MIRSLVLVFCVLVAAESAVQARDSVLSADPRPWTPTLQEAGPSYPMSYADELAQRLGIQKGYMEVFSVAPSHDGGVIPMLKGGVDRNGAGIKLQWKFPK